MVLFLIEIHFIFGHQLDEFYFVVLIFELGQNAGNSAKYGVTSAMVPITSNGLKTCIRSVL